MQMVWIYSCKDSDIRFLVDPAGILHPYNLPVPSAGIYPYDAPYERQCIPVPSYHGTLFG